MRRLALLLLATAALSGCATANVYGVVGDEDDVYTGSAIGYLTRSGTIELSNSKGNVCKGEFSYYPFVLEGRGSLTCNDGQRANIEFTGLSSTTGYGKGVSSNGRPVAFTYGMNRGQSSIVLGINLLRPPGALGTGGSGAGGSAASASASGTPGTTPSTTPARGGTGTGFYINRQGHVLTNAHVAGKCSSITVTRQGSAPVPASLVKADATNDLAVLIAQPSPSFASFRGGRPVRAGENVVAYGFPLSGILSSGGIVTNGSINALAGLGDDSRYLQISAPVQPGNSGGPLLDSSGNVVGIVTLSIKESAIARRTGGAIPQNINFALKADVARAFLDSAGVPVETSNSGRDLSVADIGEKARAFSVFIDCKR